MKLLVCWDWQPNFIQSLTWQDGLAAAIKELKNRGHEVLMLCDVAPEYIGPGERGKLIKNPYIDIFMTGNMTWRMKNFEPDAILFWADMTRPNIRPMYDWLQNHEWKVPIAICFAGGNPLGENAPFFDHIFVESEVYKKVFEDAGYPVSIAFGTNTDLFKPIPEQPKLFDTIFPATFAAWKRHHLYAQAIEGQGLKALAVGQIYDNHEQECWQECMMRGVAVMPHTSAEVLHWLYAASKVCVVPSSSAGGSQRTVLEAMAMNLPLIVTDSDKFDYAKGYAFEAEPNSESIRSMIHAALDTEVNSRDYVVKNWSHLTYADALESKLLELVDEAKKVV